MAKHVEKVLAYDLLLTACGVDSSSGIQQGGSKFSNAILGTTFNLYGWVATQWVATQQQSGWI